MELHTNHTIQLHKDLQSIHVVIYVVCHVYYHRLPYIQISAGGRSKKLRLQTVIEGHNLPYTLGATKVA
jgi:hypothetical protein